METGRVGFAFGVGQLEALLQALWQDGYQVLGAKREEGLPTLGELRSLGELDREPGSADAGSARPSEIFSRGLSRQSWKHQHGSQAKAFFGVRACDTAAIELQRSAFSTPRPPAPFVVAVACARRQDACFCTAVGGGPRPSRGYDIRLTELATRVGTRFVAEPGSPRGLALLVGMGAPTASPADQAAALRVAQQVEEAMRPSSGDGIPQALNPGSGEWEQRTEACLGCGNCVLACPTCACTSRSDTSGNPAAHPRFGPCFVGQVLQASNPQAIARRYALWVSHKITGVQPNTGLPSCTGCGRCVALCPAGLDLRTLATAQAEQPVGRPLFGARREAWLAE